MKKFTYLIIFYLVVATVNAQSPNSWQMFLNKQKIAVGIVGKPITIDLPKYKIGDLKLKIFADTSIHSFTKTILVVDTVGRQLIKKSFNAAQITLLIDEQDFIAKYGQIPFVIYSIQVPKNGMNFRFVPKKQIVCAVHWK
ncbi:MAG: hypothetical protein ACOVMI_01810 [Chitinophagaceae bacterium]